MSDSGDRFARLVRTGRYADARALVLDEFGAEDHPDRARAIDLIDRCERLVDTRKSIEKAVDALRAEEHADVEELLDVVASTPLAESTGRLIGRHDIEPGPDRSRRPDHGRFDGGRPDGGRPDGEDEGSMPGDVGLAIHLFGPFRIRKDGRAIDIGSRDRASEILRYLASAPDTGVHKDELVDRFWPDAADRAGKRSLHQAIYTLRRTLATHGAADELRFEGDRYSFGGPDRWRDVDRLDRCVDRARAIVAGRSSAGPDDAVGAALRAAGEEGHRLYRGHLLTDHPYDEWAESLREHHRSRHRELMAHLLDSYRDDGRPADVVRLGEWLLELDPADEDAARQVMQAQVGLGRPDAAAATFGRQAAHLQREIGVAPSQQSKDLFSGIVENSMIDYPLNWSLRDP